MDTSARHLQSKFGAARALITSAIAACGSKQREPERQLRVALSELAAIETHYSLEAAAYMLRRKGLERDTDFARMLAASDYAGTIDAVVDNVGFVLRGTTLPPVRRANGKHAGMLTPSLQRLIDGYPRVCSDFGFGSDQVCGGVEYDRCPACGADMVVDAGRSTLRCAAPNCGAVRELVGTVFDDSQFYSQEGQKAKSGTFNPNRHFQFWWTHILAREPDDEIGDKSDPDNMYGEKLLVALRAIVARNRCILRLLNVNDIRSMLRETGRTELNKNAPLLLKKLTGVGPPSICDAIAARVENLFSKAIEIGERVRRNGRVNRNYYPYYIYKILDQILPESDFENRRALYYIYIQSRETVEADDADWERICSEMDEITYTPTDRTKALSYAPL